MDDLEYAKLRVEVARGYGDYIPEEYEGQPEQEKFNSVLDSIVRAIEMAENSRKEDE